MTNHYQVLGVDRIASRADVEKAYRHLLVRYNKEPGAEKRLAEISEAHEVLSDPKSRAAYDFHLWKSPS